MILFRFNYIYVYVYIHTTKSRVVNLDASKLLRTVSYRTILRTGFAHEMTQYRRKII